MYIIYQALYQKTFYCRYFKMFFVPGKLFQVSVITSSKAGAYPSLQAFKMLRSSASSWDRIHNTSHSS